jgi:hypothetical protein
MSQPPHKFKVEVPGGIIFHDVESLEQADMIVARYRQAAQGAHKATADAEHLQGGDKGNAEGAKRDTTNRRARFVPTKVKVQSASKQEAMLKLYRGLKSARHQQAIRFLASRGAEGARAEEVKEAAGLPADQRISGFTASITRSAPAYDLKGEEVLIVEFLGSVHNQRIYTYRLGPEMLEAMRNEGLANPGKPLMASGGR